MNAKFNEIKIASDAAGERGDCTVKATALVTGLPYSEAHSLMRLIGRPNREGLLMSLVYSCMPGAIASLGYTVEKIDIGLRNGKNQYTPRTISERLPKGNYICIVRGHMFALVDGEVLDWSEGRCHRILTVWKITKNENCQSPV